jgi:hypothetical protein
VHTVWIDDETLSLSWSAPTDPRVTGYRIYREGVDPGWHLLENAPLATTELAIQSPDPLLMQRFAVTSVLGDGTESSLSPSETVFAESWDVSGPFPHPIGESCRFEVTVPWDVGGTVSLSARIFDVTGVPIRTLEEQVIGSGQTARWSWDRKDRRGQRVGPGYYFLRITGAGRESQQTIYVAP